MKQTHLSLSNVLATGGERLLRDANPWWRGERQFGVPTTKRWAFAPALKGLRSGLAPVTVLRGTRQVGKTTTLNQIADTLLDSGVGARSILRVQFDDLEQLRRLPAPILDLVDMQPVRAIVTGSSALRIEAGRDSLAGRLSTIEMGPLLLREIAQLRDFGALDPHLPYNGLSPLKQKDFWLAAKDFGIRHRAIRELAFDAFSKFGAYPLAHRRSDATWEEISAQWVETVVRRAIQHDLRLGERGRRRDEILLEEVFRLSCRYLGQSPSQAVYLDEVRRTLNANIGWSKVLTYLKFLDATLLVRLIPPLELRLKRAKGSPKLILSDHALRSAWLQEQVPLTAIDGT